MCYMNFAINGYTREYMTLAKDDIGVEYVGECVIVIVMMMMKMMMMMKKVMRFMK